MIIPGLILFVLGLAFVWHEMFLRWFGWPRRRWPLPSGCALLCLGALLIGSNAYATTAAQAIRAVRVPEVNAVTRRLVEQAAAEEWGVDSSPARLAAQIHQESAWDVHARSGVGAEGLAQFMPSTGRWMAQQFPELGPYDPWDAAWSARAAAVYDHWLLTRNPGASACSSWAFALSAYNGGETRLHMEQQLARRHGLNGAVWFGDVSGQRSRSPAAWRQNRGYVRQILKVLEPAYIDAGWAGEAVCA